MKNRFIVVDCETNGLPVSYTAPITDTYNWPRCTQLAWQLCEEDGKVIRRWCTRVKPDGWKIPETEFFRENGHTTEKCESEGLEAIKVYKAFLADVNSADTIVAHNLSFDLPVISCELLRYGLHPERPLKKFCTKLESEDICKIPGWKGKYRWPKLSEAYRFFFGKDFDGAHDAGADVEACKQVYLAILKHRELQDLL